MSNVRIRMAGHESGDVCAPEVGDDVYSSWFARMDLEAIEDGAVRLSVPTRFLKSWIQSHYAERVLACWQAEDAKLGRIELIVRSAGVQEHRRCQSSRMEIMVGGDNSHRFNSNNGNGRPDRQSAIPACMKRSAARRSMPGLDVRQLCGRPLQHAGSCRRQAGRGRSAHRSGDVQSALHPRRCRLGQDASAASHHLGRQRRLASARFLYLTAEKFMYGFVSALRTQTALAFKEACAASACW